MPPPRCRSNRASPRPRCLPESTVAALQGALQLTEGGADFGPGRDEGTWALSAERHRSLSVNPSGPKRYAPRINEPTSAVAPGVRRLELGACHQHQQAHCASACQTRFSGSSFAEPPGGFHPAEPEPWAGPVGLDHRPKAMSVGPDRCLCPADPSLVTIPGGPPCRLLADRPPPGRDGVPTVHRDGSLSPSPTQPAPRQSARRG